MTTQALAPSLNWLALPGVIVPPSIAGFSAASPSGLVSGRLHSSRSKVTGFSETSPVSRLFTIITVETGTISSSNLPACWAAAIRVWLLSA